MSAVNIFPANVSTPSGKWLKARVQIVDGRARVFAITNGAIDLVAEAEVTDYQARNRFSPSIVTTSEGETWEIRRASGCGCGSSLRSFDPSTWVSA